MHSMLFLVSELVIAPDRRVSSQHTGTMEKIDKIF